uniref:Structural protein n=1 Tax=Phylloscopus inornatus ambidensovirus TaxID=2794452 RepID=A0A8A4XC50_9VIRU|nr:MAG: structural protein [Phylloscopus inornatus ambidensovirus]
MDNPAFELTEFNKVPGNLQHKIVNHPNEWRQVQETEISIPEEGHESIDLGDFAGSEETLFPEAPPPTAGGPGGAGTLAGAGAAGVAGGTVGGVPTAAIPFIVGGAVVAGKGIYDGVKAHLPGHEYVGPGTDLEKAGAPVDKDDQIAKEHDEAYAKAKVQSDIQEADSKAIGAFEDDFQETGNLHSKISSVLLGGKQAVEHYTGPIYPQVIHHA